MLQSQKDILTMDEFLIDDLEGCLIDRMGRSRGGAIDPVKKFMGEVVLKVCSSLSFCNLLCANCKLRAVKQEISTLPI